MPKGYVIVNVTVTDAQRYPEYARRAAESVRAFGGRYLVRGAKAEIMEGEPKPDRVVVLEFPSIEQAHRWYDSPEYQPVKAMRHAWARSDMFFIEGHAEP